MAGWKAEAIARCNEILCIQGNVGAASFEKVFQDEIKGTFQQEAHKEGAEESGITWLVAERQPQHEGQIKRAIGRSGDDFGNPDHLILGLATGDPHEDRDITAVNRANDIHGITLEGNGGFDQSISLRCL